MLFDQNRIYNDAGPWSDTEREAMQKPMRFGQPSGRRSVSGNVSMLMRVTYALTALVWLVGLAGTVPVRSQAEPAQISPNLARQLRAVMAEKKSRTAAQKKINTSLLMAVKQHRGEATPFNPRGVNIAKDGTVVVDIKCPVTDRMTDAIEAMGGTVLNRHPRYDTIRARMQLAQIETLASKSEVRSVRIPAPMVTRQGAVVTEGDRAHRADEARSTFGLDGSGVKVCAISDGVDDLASRQAAGELPADDVEVLDGQAGVGSEGTALLEIIHDMAPGVYLGFATAFGGQEQFATNILNLRDVIGCDIIIDDVGYLFQSPFQAGVVSQAVEAVAADGAVYISSAGNDGSKAKGTSGTYEAEFVDSDANFEDLFPGSGMTFGSLHMFPSDNGLRISNQILFSGSALVLHWADPLGGSANDYDLCLANDDLSILFGCSNAIQDGDDDPFEFIGFAPSGSQAMIVNFDDEAETRFLHLQTFEGILEESTTGNIFGHPGSDAAITVGAADVNQASANGVFGPEDIVESEFFSSDGPRHVFFDAAGNPFTPGNFTSTGGIVRQKPDVTAADGVTTTTPGFETFFGTSASAPHVAGAAALLKQADPTLTPDEIEDLLESTATDIEDAGFDDTSGFGLIDAFDAVEESDFENGDGEELINDALSLDDLDTAFDPGDTRAPAGVFTIEATFTNISADSFMDVFFEVAELTGGNMLLNADGGPGGVGSRVSVPGDVNSGDTFTQTFEIGLQEASPFRFFVDAFGTPR